MCKVQCFLAIIALSLGIVNSWDIALTNDDQIEFYANGTKLSKEGTRFKKLTALAYDAVHQMLLFVDDENDNASIFSYHLNTKKYQPLVRKKLHEDIQGVAYDPLTNTLFWADMETKKIFSRSLAPEAKNNIDGKELIVMTDEKPRSIAVDSCRGYIYWTNVRMDNATIERARFDGSDRKIIIKNVSNPVSITLDQRSGRIYWPNKGRGIAFIIESSDLEGQDRKTVFAEDYKTLHSLTVSKDFLYWVDYNKIWRLPKNASGGVSPEVVDTFENNSLFGIAANYSIEDQTEGVPQCHRLVEMSRNRSAVNELISVITKTEGINCLHGDVVNGTLCECTKGYTGKRCETYICQNYCFNGECTVTNDGKPICKCNDGSTGTRCEVNVCNNFCLNDGFCIVNKVNIPKCQCRQDFEGARCEIKKVSIPVTVSQVETCNCTTEPTTASNSVLSRFATPSEKVVEDTCDGWDSIRDPIIISLGVLCGMFGVLCLVFIKKIIQLKKRPRIKKRIIVNKNVTPLTARPDQCEITIENCCNMNICETPCFEPRSTIRPNLLDAKPGKEEKRNLITNMEQPDDF